MRELTSRQREVLSFMRSFQIKHGVPPTVRELGERFRITPRAAFDHLRALERKGYLTREDMKSRALRPMNPNGAHAEGAAGEAPLRRNGALASSDFVGGEPANDDDAIDVQILGRVAAGLPLSPPRKVWSKKI